jgi:hypothetical protein
MNARLHAIATLFVIALAIVALIAILGGLFAQW